MSLSFPHSRLTNEYKICCSHEKEFNNYRAKSHEISILLSCVALYD